MNSAKKTWYIIIGFGVILSILFIIRHFTTSSEVNTQYDTFNIKVSFFNHAESLFEGERIVELKFDTIKVFTYPHPLIIIDNKKEYPIIEYLAAFNSRQTIDSILNLRLNNLKESYDNKNPMRSSGDEYNVIYAFRGSKKEIYIHHYYEPTIDKLIQILNRHVPLNLKLKTLEDLK